MAYDSFLTLGDSNAWNGWKEATSHLSFWLTGMREGA